MNVWRCDYKFNFFFFWIFSFDVNQEYFLNIILLIVCYFLKNVLIGLFLAVVLDIEFRFLLDFLRRNHPDWKWGLVFMIIWFILKWNINCSDVKLKLSFLKFRNCFNNDLCFLNIWVDQIVKHTSFLTQCNCLRSSIWDLLIISDMRNRNYNSWFFLSLNNNIVGLSNLKLKIRGFKIEVWIVCCSFVDKVTEVNISTWVWLFWHDAVFSKSRESVHVKFNGFVVLNYKFVKSVLIFFNFNWDWLT